MKVRKRKPAAILIVASFALLSLGVPVGMADHEESHSAIDVTYLQSCLKEENASLDVLVLMDSSRSLRDSRPGESGYSGKGSDPEGKRGPVLFGSLKLLQELAEESGNSFRLNLKNFGKNSDPKSLKDLKEQWIPWKEIDSSNSESSIRDFVQNALFEESQGTEWASGLSTARVEFSQRLSEAESNGEKSCSIMFWITDGVPSNPDVEQQRICSSGSEASIEWFRERNILVLGGLLKPKNEDSSQFAPIVTGEGCGRSESSWTKGSVIEAEDINSLAWQFVSLIANIKNLVNLGVSSGSVSIDRGTSRIEIYIKGNPGQWQVKGPDGAIVCSSSQPNDQCEVNSDKQIGITTITVKPNNPSKAEGVWSVTPDFGSNGVKAYGGLSAQPNPVQLSIDPQNLNVPEGKEARFIATLLNADGTPFDISGFRSVEICATLDSTREDVCKSGSATAEIGVFPSLSDSSIPFRAVVTSNKGENREYNISAVVNVTVEKSGKFPSLVCGAGGEGDVCAIPSLKNKSDKKSVVLKVLSPTDSSASPGRIYLKSFKVTRDDFARDFDFTLTDANKSIVNWGDSGTQFSPQDLINLDVSTAVSGSSQIEGVIKYVVLVDGQEVVRELKFEFGVASETNTPALIVMLLLAYLLTVGIPYAFLLWSARRNAVLAPPGNEYSYLAVPVVVSQAGKIILADSADGSELVSHRNLTKVELEARSKSTTVNLAEISTVPPKWNPFVESSVYVSVPGHHLLTTYSHGVLESERAIYNPSLVGDAILYFSNESNFNAESVSESVVNDDPFAISGYEENMQQELRLRTGEIAGQAMFIVASSGNRRKALQELKLRVQSLGEGTSLPEQILAVRENLLKETQEAEAAAKLANQGIDDGKKKKKDEKKAVVEEPEEEAENSADLFDDDSTTRGKKKSTNVWDDDDFPESDKKSDLWD
jgi:hypothetical protein